MIPVRENSEVVIVYPNNGNISWEYDVYGNRRGNEKKDMWELTI